MGITGFSNELIRKYGGYNKGSNMLEFGDQNTYFHPNYEWYAKKVFSRAGVNHTSVDLFAGKGGALPMDLSKSLDRKDWENHFDMVTNFGTGEHVEKSIYWVYRNAHECCKVGGVMIHENPKTGNWPGHGHHYMTEKFYELLAEAMEYDLKEVGEHPAMNNTKDGWNIYAVLVKKKDAKFMTEAEFKAIAKGTILKK